MKARVTIAYCGTIVAALAFVVVFLWLGWACQCSAQIGNRH